MYYLYIAYLHGTEMRYRALPTNVYQSGSEGEGVGGRGVPTCEISEIPVV